MLNIEANLTGLTNISLATALAMDYKGAAVIRVEKRLTLTDPVNINIRRSEIHEGMPKLAGSVFIKHGEYSDAESFYISYGGEGPRNKFHPIVYIVTIIGDPADYGTSFRKDETKFVFQILGMQGDEDEINGYLDKAEEYLKTLFRTEIK